MDSENGKNFEELRPGSSILSSKIKKQEKYYSTQPKDNSIKYRKIFTPPFTQEEEEIILSVSYQLKLINVSTPEWWNKQDTLRCAQAPDYHMEPCLEYIKRSIAFFDQNYNLEPSENVRKLIESQKIFIIGKNNNQQPIIFIDLKKIDKELLNEFSEAFILLMFLTREKMHLRGFIESNVIVFDVTGENSIKVGKFVNLVFDMLQRTFYSFVSKIYFFGAETSMRFMINTLADSSHFCIRNNVEIVSKLNKSQVLRHVGIGNVPVDLGGLFYTERSGPAWPMANFGKVSLERKISLERMKSLKIKGFYFTEEKYRAEWEKDSSDDDLMTIFSQANVMSSRVYASKRKRDEAKKGKFKNLIDRILSLNCCGRRLMDI